MNQKISLTPNILSKRLGEELILINLETDRIFSLNLTGAKAWEIIEDTKDLDLVKKGLLDQFDVSPELLDEELNRILNALAAEGFVTIE
jgi:hypothetical protein